MVQKKSNVEELNFNEKQENLDLINPKTKYIIISCIILGSAIILLSLVALIYYFIKRRMNNKLEKALLSNSYNKEVIK